MSGSLKSRRYRLEGAWSAYFGPSQLLETETIEDRNHDLLKALESLNHLIPEISHTLSKKTTTENQPHTPQPTAAFESTSVAAVHLTSTAPRQSPVRASAQAPARAPVRPAASRPKRPTLPKPASTPVAPRAQMPVHVPTQTRAQVQTRTQALATRHPKFGEKSRPSNKPRLDQAKSFPPTTRDQLARWLEQQREAGRSRWKASGRIIPAGSNYVTVQEEDRKK